MWRVHGFGRYLSCNFLLILTLDMAKVAIGWEIYERTDSALHLGYAGLAAFLPAMLWTLVAGHVADTLNRKHVLIAAIGLLFVATLGFFLNAALGGSVGLMYACLVASGTARPFLFAARGAFLTDLVPGELNSSAAAWNSSGFTLAGMVGPALGGVLIGASGSSSLVYAISAVGLVISIGFAAGIAYEHRTQERPPLTLRSLAAGYGFLWNAKVLLGLMLLDMFGILLGGATAMLPIYAKDVLQVGPAGLGWLAMAPSAGAAAMGFIQAHRRPLQRGGRSVLFAVAGFGAATILFGLSRTIWLSMVLLCLVGACDSVRFVVRQTLIRTLTPNHMRGRMFALTGLFMGTANELGAFESGVVASWFGPVASVVSGGIGTLGVVGAIAWLFPELRRYGPLDLPPRAGPERPTEEPGAVTR